MGGGGMMGGNGGAVQNPAAPYFWIAFVVLIGAMAVGLAGLAYYIAMPEIRVGAAPIVCETTPKQNIVVQENVKAMERKLDLPTPGQKTETTCTPLESIIKTLSDDERKVIEVLAAHEGKYLQKYIRNEVGLSRLQTHRVVARLAERGIVTLEKTGNTNNVLLADWLKR